MLAVLFGVAVGIVIGWNVPQPPWAKEIQDKVMGFFGGGSQSGR
jgi:hypothetical protein